jgi:hypothetical protein
VRNELTGEQVQDTVEILTHDMSIITNLMWHQRKEELGKRDLSHVQARKARLKKTN